MLTIAQQIAARSPIIAGLTRDTFAGLSVPAGCAYLREVVTPTVAGGLFALPAPEVEVEVERYRGWSVRWENGYGFCAERSIWDQVDWCDTIEEARAGVDEFLADELASLSGRHDDTPCLDDTFHRIEMDV